MATEVDLKIGEHILWHGHTATIVSTDKDFLTIQTEDGNEYTVPRNCIFGNKTMKAEYAYLSQQIDQCDEQIDKNKETIEWYDKVHAVAARTVKESRDKLYSLLSSLGVQNENEISDGQQKAQVETLKEELNNNTADRNGATHEIIAASNSTSTEAFRKIGYLGQQRLILKQMNCIA